MRNLLQLHACALLLSGCVGVGVGPLAIPSGAGVIVNQNYDATVELRDKIVTVRVGGYGNGVGLIGPIVPIIPLIPGAGINRSDDNLNLYFYIRPKADSTSFNPDAIRVVTESSEISADVIMQSANCDTEPVVNQIGQGETVITRPECFQLKFLKGDPPFPTFKVTSAELPELSYKVQRSVRAGLLGQR